MNLTKSKLLLVEGKDEEKFFTAFCKYKEINDIEIIELGGKSGFKSSFPAVLNFRGIENVTAIGFVQDADNSKDAAVTSLCALLHNNGIPKPTGHGQFSQKDGRSYGIFIMPGNRDSGMLENLVLDSVDGHPAKIESEKYIDQLKITLEGNADYKFPKNEPKARLFAFLAGLEKYKPSIGIASESKVFNFDSPHFDDINSFLNQM